MENSSGRRGCVIAGIRQSRETLYGFCKSEEENPWKGVMAGLVSEKEVAMTIAALENDLFSSWQLIGYAADNNLQGNYTRYNGKNEVTTGKFTAELINANVDEYIPTVVEKSDGTKIEQQRIGNQAIMAENSRFTDVRNFAMGINPTIMPNHAPLIDKMMDANIQGIYRI